MGNGQRKWRGRVVLEATVVACKTIPKSRRHLVQAEVEGERYGSTDTGGGVKICGRRLHRMEIVSDSRSTNNDYFMIKWVCGNAYCDTPRSLGVQGRNVQGRGPDTGCGGDVLGIMSKACVKTQQDHMLEINNGKHSYDDANTSRYQQDMGCGARPFNHLMYLGCQIANILTLLPPPTGIQEGHGGGSERLFPKCVPSTVARLYTHYHASLHRLLMAPCTHLRHFRLPQMCHIAFRESTPALPCLA